MKNLVIVESPAKAKTINKYLGSDFNVIASYGHIRDLPSANGSVKPDEDFELVYELSSNSKKHIDNIVKESKKVDSIYLASDPDREGESIAWHIVEALKEKKIDIDKKNIQRVSFSEITKKAIEKAFASSRQIDTNLVNAQQARRALDYLVGFTLSPILWRKLPGSKSAGRVQSVALRLIVEREVEIENFKSVEYWKIFADFITDDKRELLTQLTHVNNKKIDKLDIKSKNEADKILTKFENKEFSISEINKKEVKRNPYPPFITSTLQQEASRKLGFTAKKTMMVAQKLYEGIMLGNEQVGLITYMRTDGVQLSIESVNSARNYIEKNFGAKYLPKSPRIYKSKAKNAQEAHEAIRPTDIFKDPSSVKKFLTNDELKLYDLIWKRTLACQMENVIMNQTQINVKDNKSELTLRASGSVIKFDGFYKIYSESKDDAKNSDDKEKDKILPAFDEGENLNLKDKKSTQHHTEPPARFSEASLVKRLEELGIGRPSTYASIISVLQDREYVRVESKRFFCEDRGRLVNSFLTNFFEKYVRTNFTADLEDKLDKVSDGKLEWKELLREFWDGFESNTKDVGKKTTLEVIEVIDNELSKLYFESEEDKKCKACNNGTLQLKAGKFGIFFGCSNYPDCRNTIKLEELGSRDEESSGSEKDKLVDFGEYQGAKIELKKGPYGHYLEVNNGDKPKRVTIPKFIDLAKVDKVLAKKLIALPLKIGEYDGKEVSINIGKYGPYASYDKKFISLPSKIEFLDTRVDDIEGKIKEANLKGKVIGKHPETGKEIVLDKGRFGFFLKYNNNNYALPKKQTPNIAIDEAVLIIAKKDEK